MNKIPEILKLEERPLQLNSVLKKNIENCKKILKNNGDTKEFISSWLNMQSILEESSVTSTFKNDYSILINSIFEDEVLWDESHESATVEKIRDIAEKLSYDQMYFLMLLAVNRLAVNQTPLAVKLFYVSEKYLGILKFI